MRRWVLLLAVVFLLAVPMHAAYAADQEQDWLVLWGQVLGRHTRAVDAEVGTRVDYRALSLDPAWPQVLAGLAEENPILLKTREQKLAFWVNAYNILAIDLVIENYPVKSIRDIGSWWRAGVEETRGSHPRALLLVGRDRTRYPATHGRAAHSWCHCLRFDFMSKSPARALSSADRGRTIR